MKAVIYFALLLTPLYVPAQDSVRVQYDNREITVAPLEKSIIDKYQADEAYDYYQKPKATVTIWERIRQWFRDMMAEIFGQKAVRDVNDFLVYLIFGAAILAAVILLIKAQKNSLFYTPAKKLDFQVNEENIHEIDFEEQIELAVRDKELRKAIRLFYLYGIKVLSDRNIIDWAPGKTNHEYVDEIQPPALKSTFSNLGFYFEYVWYGHFEATDQTFGKVKTLFGQIKNTEDKN